MSSLTRGQFRTVLLIELSLVVMGYAAYSMFWDLLCSGSVIACLREQNFSLTTFFFLSFFRPFVFTPMFVFAMMAGNRFGPEWGTLIAGIGTVVSTVGLFMLAKAVGKRVVRPWLRNNLPATLTFLRSQDWKVILALRAIPLVPFDLATFCFGLADFRYTRVLWATFIGSLPEVFIFAKFADPTGTLWGSTLASIAVLSTFILLPGLLFEFMSRKRGKGLWMRLKAMGQELVDEVRYNNTIVKRHKHDPQKIPVLLLYGFFSSRKSVTILEKILTARGYEVLSFNMGGALGTFFTKSITEAAEFIDFKLKRQIERHQLQEIYIVGHSKGGLVALWWLLKMGGHEYCHKLVTLGSPFKGTLLTWLALVTPIGFIFRSMWQMRPGSQFLKTLNELPIPPGLQIFNLYSHNDRVTTGDKGVLSFTHPQVHRVPMHHVTHFGFLHSRDVGDVLGDILGSPDVENVLRDAG